MRSSQQRDQIRKINKDRTLSRIEKTRKIQKLLTGHVVSANSNNKISNTHGSRKKIDVKMNMLDTIKGIVHCKKQDSQFVAAGIKLVSEVPSSRPSDEFCIFSRENLRECTASAIVVSSTRKGQLEWKYLCKQNLDLNDKHLKGVHLFDSNYLIEYVKREGVEYVKCPLCRQGASQKKKVQEHEVESLDSLLEKRDLAQKTGDIQMVFFNETLIIIQTVQDNWDPQTQPGRYKTNKDHLRKITNSWAKRWSVNEFIRPIKQCITKCLTKDNVHMLEVIIHELFKQNQSWSQKYKNEFLIEAASLGATDCVRYLIQVGAIQTYDAPALKAGVETRNEPLLEIIMNSMLKQTDTRFVCGQLFPAVIKYNMVDCAKQIIETRWHKPTPQDIEIAASVDNEVYRYLLHRQCAAQESLGDFEEGDLDLDDWGGDDDAWGNDNDGQDDKNDDDNDEDWG